MQRLKIDTLHVKIGEKEILKGLNLELDKGEIVALMGPNGSGKSTLSHSIMGKEECIVTSGKIELNGEDLAGKDVEERSKAGIFLSYQHPPEIAGVMVQDYLKAIVEAHRGKVKQSEFRRELRAEMKFLGIDTSFLRRSLNVGFSGGEKKRMEILQLRLLRPTLAVLDETDSGLDIDALKTVAEGVKKTQEENPEMSVLVITHYKRLLEHLQPDRVMVLSDGKIVREGGAELVEKLENEGYSFLQSAH